VEGYFVDQGAGEFMGSRPPVPGNDIYLTIDIELQRVVEQSFAWDKGSVIVMDPNNGEVLAAVSRPAFNPNIFKEGVSEQKWQELFEDPAKPLFNRTVQAAYPPGSVFKLVTAYAGLSNRLITEATTFVPCYGGYRFGNRYFRCWKPEGHGRLALRGAIEQSCDVYFYQVGEILKADQFAIAGRLFGFGRKTGVDLPSEVVGILPDKEYYDNRFGKRKWTQGYLINYSIGQGELLATPVQICAMTAVFANGGNMVHPHFLKKIVNADGGVIREDQWVPDPLPKLDTRVLRLIRRGMLEVVSGEHGTGRAAAIAGVEVAGKTGTAQNPHGEDHALFVAYAPVADPEVVLAIVMENAGHGGAMAAPVARQILSAYFHVIASGGSRRDAVSAP
jgi:penicillin-binding protein 2